MSAHPPGAPETTEFAVLLFTDICDSTALKAKHGALAYKAAAELHNALFEKIAAEEKLTLIKNTGDGYFARTTSVAAAVRFALRFQHGMRETAWPGFALATRVGIHAGEVADITTLGQSDVVAPAADLVARVMSLAVGGQILLTRGPFDEARHFVRAHPTVAELAEPPDLAWLAHGPYLFKGGENPVEVFEVGAEGRAPLVAPPDGEKAKRAIRPGEEVTLGWRPAVGLEVPGRVGWDLTRKIGEGGFGEVWLAEHGKLKQRRVFKFCFDDERLRSFKRELTFFRLIRDALGERDDIARLYDVKLDEPPFFLESEFAERGNLVEWAEREGGVAAIPLARRLDLAARIAEAVAAAHSVGILHKDLKPQNVLMQAGKNGEAFPQLTDFGIGALTDKAALDAHAITAAGFTVNTLVSSSSGSGMTRLYAPPEQLTGKAYTVQGDVYALGVVLYQLVVGDFGRALAPGWEREVQDPLLREDIAGCVDGDPARRFPSAAEVAERLRTLEQRRSERARQVEQARLEEELAAAEASAAANRVKWKRTRRVAAVVGVLAIVAVCAGIYAALQAVRAGNAEKLASERLDHAAKARDAAESLITEAIHGLRLKLLAVGKVEVMEDMVKAADAYYRRLPAELANDETQRHLASLALNRALIAGALGQDAANEEHTREALRITEELIARHPTEEKLQDEACIAMLNLCHLYTDLEKTDPLLAMADAIAERSERWLKQNPQSIAAMRYQALGHGLAAHSLFRLGKHLQGYARFQLVSTIAKRMREIGGETAEVCEVEGGIHYGNANIAGKLMQADREISEFEAAAASFARALELGGDHALVRELHMGTIHHAGANRLERVVPHGDEDIARGEALMRQALEGRRKLVELEPGRAEWWRDLAHSYEAFGRHSLKTDPQKAVQHFDEALRCREEAIKRHPSRPLLVTERAYTYEDFAVALVRLSPPDFPRAAECQVRTLEDWARSVEMTDFTPIIVREIKHKADRLRTSAARDPAAVLPLLIRARERLEPLLGKMKGETDLPVAHGVLLTALRETYQKLGRAKEAGELDAAVLALPANVAETGGKSVGRAYELLRAIWAAPAPERPRLATELGKFAGETFAWLDQHRSTLGESRHARLRGALGLPYGTALVEAKAYAEAEPVLREALQSSMRAKEIDPAPPDAEELQWTIANIHVQLGRAITSAGRAEEGQKLEREGVIACEAVARQARTHSRLRTAGSLWRAYALRLPTASDADAQEAWEKGIALAREAARTVSADTGAAPDDRAGTLSEAGWILTSAGHFSMRLKRAPEAETLFREALGHMAESARIAPGASRAFQLSKFRYYLCLALLENGRAAEAGEQFETLEKEIRASLEQPGGNPDLDREGKGWMEQLRSRLGKL